MAIYMDTLTMSIDTLTMCHRKREKKILDQSLFKCYFCYEPSDVCKRTNVFE